MKVIELNEYGAADALHLADLPTPKPGAGEIRVKLQAAGVAPIDTKLRAGFLQKHFALTFPKVLGRDGVGVVDELGEGVTNFKVGDKVCLMADPSQNGTYAEGVICKADSAVPRPTKLSLFEAAVLLQPGISAWIPVMETGVVQSGMKVLVHGGAGAVGSLMIQLCRHLGAHVTATCRSTNVDYVKQLGAHEAIAYDTDDFTKLRDMDIVFDVMGGDTHDRSYKVLRKGGHLVYLTAAPIVDRGEEFGVKVTRAMISEKPYALNAVAALASEGVLKPRVAGVYALADIAKAHVELENGRVTRGRLAIDIDSKNDSE